MPNNVITVQVGQCGNQLGMAYWERMCLEHGIAPDGHLFKEDRNGEDCKEIFYNESNCGQKWVPRAVLVDLEPRVLNEICNNETNLGLFDLDNVYNGPSGGGAGNNWATGYNQSESVIEDIMSIIELEAERADHLEAFAICHSILGGTGSGLGSRLLEELRQRYPKNVIQTYSTVQPMTCNVHVAPYNIVLTLSSIIDNADMCLLFDNDAFERQCKATNSVQKLRRDVTSDDLTNPEKNYAQINSMMSQVMTGLSAPMRFYSPIYTCLMHVSAFLNPFPPMIFSQPAVVPFVSVREEAPKQLIKFPEPRTVLYNLLDPRNLISSNQPILKKMEKEEPSKGAICWDMATDQEDYLLSGLIVLQSAGQDPMMRFAGSVSPSPEMGVADLHSLIRSRIQSRTKYIYRHPPWLSSTLNVTSCHFSPYMNHDQHPITGLLLANNTSVRVSLKKMRIDFEKMWKRKANVHGYESAFEHGDKELGKVQMEQYMNASKESLDKLLDIYREACSEKFLDGSLTSLFQQIE